MATFKTTFFTDSELRKSKSWIKSLGFKYADRHSNGYRISCVSYICWVSSFCPVVAQYEFYCDAWHLQFIGDQKYIDALVSSDSLF